MAIRLKCQACQDAVTAQDTDRGSTVKCGTCWADVPVPKAEPVAAPPARPAPAAQPILKATPLPSPAGTAPVVAKALPLPSDSAPMVATALPVPAPVKPATLNPIGERERRSDRDDRRSDRDEKRSKFKTRDREDDKDDDRPRRTSSGGGKGVLIAFICLGVVVLLGAGVVGAVLFLRSAPDDTLASGHSGEADVNQLPPIGGNIIPKPNLNLNPVRPQPGDFNPNELAGGGPNPNVPQPNRGGAVAGWKNFRGGGFSVLSPAKMTKSDTTFAHNKFFKGDKYEAAEGNDLEVHAWEIGLEDGVSVTTPDFVAAATFNLKEKIQKSEIRTLPHGEATVFTTREINFENGAVLVTQTNDKVFVFRIRWKNAVADGAKKRDEFLSSIRILNAPVVNNQPNPGGPLDMNRGRPNLGGAAWEELAAASGFTVQAPGGKRATKPESLLVHPPNGPRIGVKKYVAEDDACQYHALVFDLPADYDPDVKALFVNPVVPHFNTINNSSEATKVDGKDGVKLDIRQHHGLMQQGVSVKVGYRLFCFCVFAKNVFTPANDPTLRDRTDKFLKSVKITFDPKTADPYADEPKWVAMAKANGFGVLVPRNATVVTDKQVGFGFGQDVTMGKEFVTDVDGITYTVTVHIATPKLSVEKIATELRGRETVSNSGQVKVNGLTFENYELKHFFGHPILFRATAVGNTVFTLRTVRSEQFGKQIGDKEFTDKSAKFFDSFRIGAAPVDGGGGGAVAATGEFVQLAAGKVKPFWGAVFLTNAKELITVGVRDPLATPPGGVLRRYSVPDFKLKATYHMALPAHRVVADEKGGKLYVATVAAAADAKLSEREAAIVSGEIQVFDLKQILGGTVVELDQLKSTANLYVGAQVSGLKVTPLGDAVYVSCVQLGGTKARPTYRGKLIKFDTATNKGTDLTCEAPVWAMDLSYDGRRLAVVERPLPAAPGRGGNLVFIDGPNWKRLKAVPLTGDPTDVAFVGNRAGVLENSNGTLKATIVDPDGESSELPLAGDVRYLKATPDGKKLLASAGLPSNGLMAYTADGAKPPKWSLTTSAADLGGTALGGMCTLSVDGKLLALNAGVVIDLGASGGK